MLRISLWSNCCLIIMRNPFLSLQICCLRFLFSFCQIVEQVLLFSSNGCVGLEFHSEDATCSSKTHTICSMCEHPFLYTQKRFLDCKKLIQKWSQCIFKNEKHATRYGISLPITCFGVGQCFGDTHTYFHYSLSSEIAVVLCIPCCMHLCNK